MKKSFNNRGENTKNLDLFLKESLNVQQLLSIRGGDGTEAVETTTGDSTTETNTEEDQRKDPINW